MNFQIGSVRNQIIGKQHFIVCRICDCVLGFELNFVKILIVAFNGVFKLGIFALANAAVYKGVKFVAVDIGNIFRVHNL